MATTSRSLFHPHICGDTQTHAHSSTTSLTGLVNKMAGRQLGRIATPMIHVGRKKHPSIELYSRYKPRFPQKPKFGSTAPSFLQCAPARQMVTGRILCLSQEVRGAREPAKRRTEKSESVVRSSNKQ